MFRRIQHVHFVGIGGIGMSGIAEVLVNLGFRVSGSDLKRSNVTDRLQHMGVEIFEGHAAENVGHPHVVVRSTAVRDDNPEIVEANRRSIPVIPRAEMLAELMRLKPHTVAVAGSHGKTTTTSMVATVLGHAGLDPTMVVGGVVGAFGSNAHLGTSDLMVVEADESDRSFLMLTPTIAVVTNIDREHMDYYHDMDDVRACFANFVNKVPFYGSSVLCLDDPNVQAIIPLLERRRLTYGLSAQADVSAHGIRHDNNFGSSFTVWRGTDVIGEMVLRVPGVHNVYNALAAIAVGFELEVSFEKIVEGLHQFTGAGRRFQAKGEVGGVLVQPHRYTRTHDLMQEFARSFNNADVLFISDIYAASEDPIEGVNSETLTAAIKRFGHKDANYIGPLDNAATILREHVQPGDLVLTLGAGTVNRVSEQLLGLLKEETLSATDKHG